MIAVDPLAQQVTMEMKGSRWRDGELVEEDERAHILTMATFFTYEVRMMLQLAGFTDIEMRGDHSGDGPNRDTQSVAFIAKRPSRR